MRQPLVHVLIINWNGMDHLRDCFDTLLQDPYVNVKYVLVDNGSTDGSVEFVRDTYGADPRVDIMDLGQNLGWSGGNNEGIIRALKEEADYVFLLNNDTAVSNPCISALVAFAEEHPEAGCLAPRMVLFDQPEILNSVGIACSVIGGCWDIGLGRLDGPKWHRQGEVIGACGGAAFFRAAALRKAGLLPVEFVIYLDDLDLCLRIWNAGYRVLSFPDVVIRHKFSATMGTGDRFREKYYLNVRNRAYVIARNFPVTDALRYLPTYIAGECRATARGILSGNFWKVATHCRAGVAALRYLPEGRRSFAAHGNESPAFRHLLRTGPLFFPGSEFPENGWYAERTFHGQNLRPISKRAIINNPAARLRVTLTNCYPRLGVAEVRVSQGSGLLTTLTTSETISCTVEPGPGPLLFEATTIFDADDTGERADFGGWLAVTEVE